MRYFLHGSHLDAGKHQGPRLVSASVMDILDPFETTKNTRPLAGHF
jgi:hypothetical protein